MTLLSIGNVKNKFIRDEKRASKVAIIRSSCEGEIPAKCLRTALNEEQKMLLQFHLLLRFFLDDPCVK